MSISSKNPTRPHSIQKRLDQNLSTNKQIIKGAIDSVYAPDLFKGLQFFKGTVLEVVDSETFSWDSFTFSDSKNPKTLKRYRIRVEDLHANIPDPYLNEQGNRVDKADPLLVGMHPLFVSFSELTPPASIGQIVWVTFGNTKTFEDPIYFSPIYNNSTTEIEPGSITKTTATKPFHDLLNKGVPIQSLGTVVSDLNASLQPATIKELLEQISINEGTNDEKVKKYGYSSGYDVTLGYGKYDPKEFFDSKKKSLRKLKISEVKTLQEEIKKKQGKSSAVGKYQIVKITIEQFQKKTKVSDDALFDEQMQDRIGEFLLNRRGLQSYLKRQITPKQFQDKLAQEWSSIPMYGSNLSYYSSEKTASNDKLIKTIEGLIQKNG